MRNIMIIRGNHSLRAVLAVQAAMKKAASETASETASADAAGRHSDDFGPAAIKAAEAKRARKAAKRRADLKGAP